MKRLHKTAEWSVNEHRKVTSLVVREMQIKISNDKTKVSEDNSDGQGMQQGTGKTSKAQERIFQVTETVCILTVLVVTRPRIRLSNPTQLFVAYLHSSPSFLP